MLLPESKSHVRHRRRLTSLLDGPSNRIGPAEVNADIRPQRAVQAAAQIRVIEDAIAHAGKQALEIGTAEVGAGLEFGEGIVGGADGVEDDVGGGVEVEALGEVSVDLEKFDAGAGRAAGPGGGRERGGRGLRFERGQERLEPFERRRVATHPDELDTPETPRWVRPGA